MPRPLASWESSDLSARESDEPVMLMHYCTIAEPKPRSSYPLAGMRRAVKEGLRTPSLAASSHTYRKWLKVTVTFPKGELDKPDLFNDPPLGAEPHGVDSISGDLLNFIVHVHLFLAGSLFASRILPQ